MEYGVRVLLLPLPGCRGKTVHVPPHLAAPWPSRLLPHALPQIRSARPIPSGGAKSRALAPATTGRRGGRGTRAPQGPPSCRSSSSKGKMSSAFSGDETAPFFGFLGAAAALVFSCTWPPPPRPPILYFPLHCLFPNLSGEMVGADPFLCSDLPRFRVWMNDTKRGPVNCVII